MSNSEITIIIHNQDRADYEAWCPVLPGIRGYGERSIDALMHFMRVLDEKNPEYGNNEHIMVKLEGLTPAEDKALKELIAAVQKIQSGR